MKTKSKILLLFSGLILTTLSMLSYAGSQQYSFASDTFNTIYLNRNIRATIQATNQLDTIQSNTVTVIAKSLSEIKVYMRSNPLISTSNSHFECKCNYI